MTEQTMVGRVADAICSESAVWLYAPLCRMAYEDMARAAIEAMEDHRTRSAALGLTKGNWPRDWSGNPFPLEYIETHRDQFPSIGYGDQPDAIRDHDTDRRRMGG